MTCATLSLAARDAMVDAQIRNALKSNYFKKQKVKPAGEVWEREMWVPAKRHERGAKKVRVAMSPRTCEPPAQLASHPVPRRETCWNSTRILWKLARSLAPTSRLH